MPQLAHIKLAKVILRYRLPKQTAVVGEYIHGGW